MPINVLDWTFIFYFFEESVRKDFMNELNQLGLQNPTQKVDLLPIYQDLQLNCFSSKGMSKLVALSLFTCLKLYLWKISYNIQISSITWPNHGFWWRLVVDSSDNSLTISFELYLRNAKFSSKTYCPTNCQGYFIFTQLTLKKQLCIYTKSFNSTKARYHASLYQISFASSTYVRLPIF